MKSMNNSQRKNVNVRMINKMRWIAGVIMSSLVIVLTTMSVTLNLIDFYSDSVPEAGVGTLRMFTTLSNIIVTIMAFMCLPFQIKVLKKDKYKLPAWIVTLLYIGTVFGGFYASISGNYITVHDLSVKYEMTDRLSKTQLLAVSALLFGKY